MAQLFANQAGQKLLASLRGIFKEKRIYHRKHRFILFVCGGKLGEGETSLRKQFIEWAEHNLPRFICLLAEDALKDSFAGEGQTFVNLATFESIIAEVADCVLIFCESEGSFAEAGFFANSEIREKTLIVNPLRFQAEDSFLNLGPIDTISRDSLLKLIQIDEEKAADFAPIQQRLERLKWPEHRQRLPYKTFGRFNFREKLLVVFEMLRLLRLADVKTLRHALVECFGGNPRNQELKHLLRILLAAKFIKRDQKDAQYFKVVAGLNLIEFDHYEIEKVFAQVTLYYYNYSRELYDALSEVAN